MRDYFSGEFKVAGEEGTKKVDEATTTYCIDLGRSKGKDASGNSEFYFVGDEYFVDDVVDFLNAIAPVVVEGEIHADGDGNGGNGYRFVPETHEWEYLIGQNVYFTLQEKEDLKAMLELPCMDNLERGPEALKNLLKYL